MNKRISIIGSGWLGMPLGSELVKKGYTVSGSTTTKEKLQTIMAKGIKPHLISFAPNIQAEGDTDFFTCDVLIICIPPKRKAGLGTEYVKQIEEIINISNTGNVKHILLISSTSVYPDLNREVTEEDIDYTSVGNLSKNLLETANLSLLEAEGLVMTNLIPSTIVRFAGLIGPGRLPGRFFAGKKDVGGTDNPVNLIHMQDCIGIIEGIIAQELWGEIFNACSDLHPPKKDFYTKAVEKLSLIPPEFTAKPEGFKIINSQKIKGMLNYSFKFPDPYQMI
jgi:nucleoside-diphosphate-sugar epimerase